MVLLRSRLLSLNIIITLFYICGANILTIRTGYIPAGNELEQFQQYFNLSQARGWLVFDKAYETMNAQCNNKDINQPGCLGHIDEEIVKDNPSLLSFWTRNWLKLNDSSEELQVDCSYNLLPESIAVTYLPGNINATNHNSHMQSPEKLHPQHLIHIPLDRGTIAHSSIYATFTIAQSGCQSGFPSPGGSSFHISIDSATHTNVCGVVDRFDNYYNVTCYLPIIYRDNATITISAQVEYEHFDAFGIEGATQDKRFRMDKFIFRDFPLPLSSSPSSPLSNEMTLEAILYPPGSTSGPWNSTTHTQIIRSYWELNDTINKKPTWHGETNFRSLSQKQFDQCRKQTNLLFVGESHQRFTWDYFAYEYLNGQKAYLKTLSSKHGDISFPNVSLSIKYFFFSIVNELNTIDCSSPNLKLPTSIAIQSGSWDLGFTSLRNILGSENFAKGLIESIKALAKKTCAKSIRLVYVNTMPYPHCIDNSYCRNSRHRKSNPGITAMDQFILQELLRAGYPNLQVVDAMGIIKPSLIDEACTNHFICRHGSKQSFRLQVSEAGIALAQEMIKAMCDGFIS